MSQELLGELFDRTTTAMLLADDERRYVAANEAACSTLGVDRETLLSLRIEDLVDPEIRGAVAEQWSNFIAAGSQSGPYRLRTPDGRDLDVLYSATANVVPGLHLSIFLSPELADAELDVSSEQDDAEMAEDAEAVPQGDILSDMLGNSATAMLVVDDERRFVTANQAFFDLLESDRETIENLRIEDVVPDSVATIVEERFGRLLKDGSQWGPVRIRTFGGTDLAVIYSGTARILPGRHLLELLQHSSSEPEFNFSHERIGGSEGGQSLSPREREVLSLLALGETNQSIAARLELSPETVRNHTRSARQKLGAKSRSHAIAIAVQTRQLELGPEPAA